MFRLAQLNEQIKNQTEGQAMVMTNQKIEEVDIVSTNESMTNHQFNNSFSTMASSPFTSTSSIHTSLGKNSKGLSSQDQEKYMLLFGKMTQTILALAQFESGKESITHQSGMSMIKEETASSMDQDDMTANLSSLEKKRLSIQERIRARKSVVADNNQKQKDLEISNLKYEI